MGRPRAGAAWRGRAAQSTRRYRQVFAVRQMRSVQGRGGRGWREQARGGAEWGGEERSGSFGDAGVPAVTLLAGRTQTLDTPSAGHDLFQVA